MFLNILQIGNGTIPVLPPITLANAFGDLTATLILLTLMISITVRTLSEFIEKLINGEISSFNKKYAITAGIAFISSLPIAMSLFPEGAKIFLAYFGEWGLAGALLMVAVYGYGWNHGVNKLAGLLGHFFTASSKSSEPTFENKSSQPVTKTS